MTRQLSALLVALALVMPFVMLRAEAPHAGATAGVTWAEARDLICTPDRVWDCDTALSVAWRESRFVATAYNPTCGCAGWFQIARVHGHSLSTLFDPEANTEIAYRLWLTQGWAPWRE